VMIIYISDVCRSNYSRALSSYPVQGDFFLIVNNAKVKLRENAGGSSCLKFLLPWLLSSTKVS